MADGAAKPTGSPTIDRAIERRTAAERLLAAEQHTTETRAYLGFDAETPAPQEALLLRERSELQNTVLRLEATAQRAMADNEATNRELSALKGTTAPPQVESNSTTAITALTAQVAMLAEMMGTMQQKLQAREANQGELAQNQGTSAQNPKPRKATPKAHKPSSCESSHSSDEDEEDWLIEQDESGPACVSIFSRSIRYTITDPDRISERKDVDGVDSEYKRICDKRPHLVRDATNTTGKRGSEIGDLARALHSRLADGLEPQPSRQCSVGLTIFALHDKGDATLQRKIQNALMAARSCKTATAIKEISKQCRKSRRVPAALLTGATSFSDSALTMAIKREALDGNSCLIQALFNFVVQVLSMDRSPTTTLSNLETEWTSISCEDVEDALQEELNVYERAQKLLRHQPGNKAFSTFTGRVENMLTIREKTHVSVRDKFYDRLDLDNLALIEISWDEAWDRIIDADVAASRQRKQKKKPKEPTEESSYESPKKQICVLHGEGSHTSIQCKDMAKLGADPVTVMKLKQRRLCVWDYYDKCGKGAGCNAGQNGGRCSYQHLANKELYEANIRGTHLLASPGSRDLSAMPAMKDEDPEDRIQMPLMALGFPDEPPLPDGLCCGAIRYDIDDERTQFPCILDNSIYYSSDNEDPLYN